MALPLVFDYLADPKLNVRRAGVPGFWALSKVAIFVSKLENLHSWTFAKRIHQSERV